jgi:hypothetical protein
MPVDPKREPYTGSCLCGAVRYAFDVEPRVTAACHCSLCRKATGSAFGVWTMVAKERFRWTAGESEVAEFRSSDDGRRFFCKRCGATLGNLSGRRPDFMHVAAGTLDHAPAVRVAFHVYVASKAPWHELTDALPRFDEEFKRR